MFKTLGNMFTDQSGLKDLFLFLKVYIVVIIIFDALFIFKKGKKCLLGSTCNKEHIFVIVDVIYHGLTEGDVLQFKFGVSPPEEDSILKEPCLEVCPNATHRRIAATNILEMKCPKA